MLGLNNALLISMLRGTDCCVAAKPAVSWLKTGFFRSYFTSFHLAFHKVLECKRCFSAMRKLVFCLAEGCKPGRKGAGATCRDGCLRLFADCTLSYIFTVPDVGNVLSVLSQIGH